MPIDIVKFFTPGNFFDLRASADHGTIVSMLYFFGAMVVIGIIIKIIQTAKRAPHFLDKIFQMYFLLFTVMGAVGLLLVWFRYEHAYFLSARFWLVIWLASLVWWLYAIIRYQVKVVPQAREQLEQKKIFSKYLPQRK